jgi:hypothetical protein
MRPKSGLIVEVAVMAPFWAKPMRDDPELGRLGKMVPEAHPWLFRLL